MSGAKIKCICLACGAALKARPEHAGAALACPQCGQLVAVPALFSGGEGNGKGSRRRAIPAPLGAAAPKGGENVWTPSPIPQPASARPPLAPRKPRWWFAPCAIALGLVAATIALAAIAAWLDPARRDAKGAAAHTIAAIRERLKAAKTAEFAPPKVEPRHFDDLGETWYVSGAYDAQNGFGTFLRGHYKAIVSWKLIEGWTVDALIVDDDILVVSDRFQERVRRRAAEEQLRSEADAAEKKKNASIQEELARDPAADPAVIEPAVDSETRADAPPDDARVAEAAVAFIRAGKGHHVLRKVTALQVGRVKGSLRWSVAGQIHLDDPGPGKRTVRRYSLFLTFDPPADRFRFEKPWVEMMEWQSPTAGEADPPSERPAPEIDAFELAREAEREKRFDAERKQDRVEQRAEEKRRAEAPKRAEEARKQAAKIEREPQRAAAERRRRAAADQRRRMAAQWRQDAQRRTRAALEWYGF